jgi:hypothetical protein
MLTRSAQFYEKIFGFRVISYFAPRGCAMGADTAKYWPGNMACASSSSISGESITRRGNRPLPSRARTKEAIRDGENVLVVDELPAKSGKAVARFGEGLAAICSYFNRHKPVLRWPGVRDPRRDSDLGSPGRRELLDGSRISGQLWVQFSAAENKGSLN